MKNLFTKAHKMAREIKAKYPEVDYKFQFGLCLSFLHQSKEENEMTMQKWFEGLTDKEKSGLKDGAEARTGFLRNGETAEEWKARGRESYDSILAEKYNQYLKNLNDEKIKEEKNKQIEEEEKMQYEQDLQGGIATIELYESNKYSCWTAEIIGTDSKYGFKRDFVNPTKTQGNYKTYELKEGGVYNYLNGNKQHFVKVVNSRLMEVSKAEIQEMLK